jgi:beta-galactosidase
MRKQSLDSQWRFNLGDYPSTSRGKPDDSTWRMVDLPHDWSIELPRNASNPSGNAGGYFPMGTAWYHKNLHSPEEWRGKKVFLEFEGIYMNADLWLNEHTLGRHPYGYTSFLVDLTPYLKIGEDNLLRIFVDNAGQLNSRWYSGSGIYRHVWLMVTEPVHVAHWGVYVTTPEVSAQSARVCIRTQVANDSGEDRNVTLRSQVFAPDGKQVGTLETAALIRPGGQHDFEQVLEVAQPKLWSPDAPALYRVESEVLCDVQVLDHASTPFGIRSLHFSADQGFLLNGQPLKLKGGCVHHDNGVLGSASFDRAEERKVEIHKASGFNAIRCAHNPPAPTFLDACDRLGMLVMDEAFDCWRDGKNHYDYHVVFDDWWQRDLDSMLLRDRNHPCVILWSIGNEVMERDGRSNGAEIARMLAQRVQQLDPTRPVTSAICGVWDKNRIWEDTDTVFAHLGVGGYNYQWKQYIKDHQRHPQRMMIGTESFPKESFENWMSVLDNSYILGDFVWTSLDYLGESGIGRVQNEEIQQFLGEYPWHQANCGDLDLCGVKRPQSYYRDILWGVGHPLYIAVHAAVPEGKTSSVTLWGWEDVWHTWNWAGCEGKFFKVDVYSACEEVELFLNGHSLGIKPTTRQERLTASFEVAYQPGELKAVGFKGGMPNAEYILHTSGKPTALHLTPDREHIPASAQGLSYVTVELTDFAGQVVPDADRCVYFTTQGAGRILAVGSANPVSIENYRGSQRETFRGRCLVVVQSNSQTGEICLCAQADDVDGAKVVIRAG